MKNKFHNIKVYKTITVISAMAILGIILYTPIHRANMLKTTLYKERYNQIQYLNSQSYIIPQAINIIKGHIIHNEKALKDIVYINMLTKVKNNNIRDIYNNQIKIFTITKNLIDNANKNSLLNKNKDFQQTKKRFDEIYLNAYKQHEICKARTQSLKKYTTLPVYRNVINASNLNDITCID